MDEKSHKQKIIYVCTQGDYSDYHIAGVFDDEKLAYKFASHFHCEVEEWPLNPFGPELSKGYFPFSVRMTKKGDTVAVHRVEADYAYRREADATIHTLDWTGNLLVYCWAKDKEHAIKIANETRAQLLATNQWPEQKQRRR